MKFRSVDVLVCRRFGLSTFWFVDVLVCRRFGLSTFWFVDVLVCRRFGLSTFWPATLMMMMIMITRTTTTRKVAMFRTFTNCCWLKVRIHQKSYTIMIMFTSLSGHIWYDRINTCTPETLTTNEVLWQGCPNHISRNPRKNVNAGALIKVLWGLHVYVWTRKLRKI